MNTALTHLLEQYGLAVVFGIVFVDQLGIPIPAIPVLVVAGTLAAAGRVSAPQLFFGAVLACVVADCIWFMIGKTYGMRVLKTLCRISLEPDSCVSQTQSRFERWGVNSLIVAKFIPGLAVVAPPVARALRVTWPRFVFLSAIGAALWVAAGVGAGMAFKAQVERLFALLTQFGGLAAMGFGALFIAYIAYKWLDRRRFLAALRMARISVDELYALLGSGRDPVILDVRTHVARGLQPRWIPTSIHAPLDEIAQRLDQLPRDREIIVYCTCPNEASAAVVAKQLMDHGFRRVRPLHGGLDAWIAAGYSVDPRAPARTEARANDSLASASSAGSAS
jgi:membrane protein DedA with SNARE-associated domain/rhodanese-related sulfurtransferase